MRAPVIVWVSLFATACPPDDEGDDELFDPALAPDAPGGAGVQPSICDLPTNKATGVVPAQPGAIYFGTRMPTLVPLDERQQNAVVGITDRATAGTFCTGTLVSDDVVLTAQHCVEGYDALELVILFGADEFAPLLEIDALDVDQTDPDTDLAVIRLERAVDADVATPIAVATSAPGDDDIGNLVETAGYGDTHDGSEGRFFAAEVFDSFDDDFITVNGEGRRGVCFGDSGGPLLAIVDNQVRVRGVLSFGDPECTNFDNFSRVDNRRAFIEQMTGPTPTPAPEPCPADVSDDGSCSLEQSLAQFCDGGFVVRDVCARDEICAQGRCIPQADNPCGAATRFGRCDDEVLTWCDDDVVRVRNCAACSERCLLGEGVAGYGCVPSNCGALDREGVCQGTLARWCDAQGQLEERECGEDGCQYLGPVFGNYCYDPVACRGETYQGRCDGSVLIWCEDLEVNVVDCADDGTACVFEDEQTGFICE